MLWWKMSHGQYITPFGSYFDTGSSTIFALSLFFFFLAGGDILLVFFFIFIWKKKFQYREFCHNGKKKTGLGGRGNLQILSDFGVPIHHRWVQYVFPPGLPRQDPHWYYRVQNDYLHGVHWFFVSCSFGASSTRWVVVSTKSSTNKIESMV